MLGLAALAGAVHAAPADASAQAAACKLIRHEQQQVIALVAANRHRLEGVAPNVRPHGGARAYLQRLDETLIRYTVAPDGSLTVVEATRLGPNLRARGLDETRLARLLALKGGLPRKVVRQCDGVEMTIWKSPRGHVQSLALSGWFELGRQGE